MDSRYPVYAEADLTVDSQDGPPDATLERVLEALSAFDPAADPKTAVEDGRRAVSS